MVLYTVNTACDDEEDQLAQSLSARSNIGVVELSTAILLDACGVRAGGGLATVASTDLTAPSPLIKEMSSFAGELASMTSLSEGGESELNLSAVQRVLDLVEYRRQSLSPALTLTLNQLTMVNGLDDRKLFHTIESLVAAKASQVEHVARFLSDLSKLTAAVDYDIESHRSLLKLDDSTGSDAGVGLALCKRFVKQMEMLPDECCRQELTVYANDLVCRLGDLIDDKHRRRSQLARSLSQRVASAMETHAATHRRLAIDLPHACCTVCSDIVRAFTVMRDLLQTAGYESFPWEAVRPPADLSEHVRGLEASLGLLYDSLTPEHRAEVEPEFASVLALFAAASNDTWLVSGALEAMQVCRTLAEAFTLAVSQGRAEAEGVMSALQSRVNAVCEEEHDSLDIWDQTLCALLTGLVLSVDPDFRSMLIANRAADTRDKLRAFVMATPYRTPSQQPSSLTQLSDNPPQISLETLVQLLPGLVSLGRSERSLALALNQITYRDAEGRAVEALKSFVHEDANSCSSFRASLQAVVRRAVMSQITAPGLKAVLRLASLFPGSLKPGARVLRPLQTFLREASEDSKLLNAFSLTRAQLQLVLEAFGRVCSDDTDDGLVVVQEVVQCLALCCGGRGGQVLPRYLEDCCRRGLGAVNTSTTVSDLPSLQHACVFRVALLAAHYGNNSQESDTHPPTAVDGLASVAAPALSRQQLCWALRTLQLEVLDPKLGSLVHSFLPRLRLVEQEGTESSSAVLTDVGCPLITAQDIAHVVDAYHFRITPKPEPVVYDEVGVTAKEEEEEEPVGNMLPDTSPPEQDEASDDSILVSQ
jgi:hypothetical protein